MVVGAVGFSATHVPFSGEVSFVTICFEKSGEVECAVGEDRLHVGCESSIAEAAGVTTGEGGDARGCALRHRVVTSAEGALCGEGVEVRGVDFSRVVIADVSPALVIGDDGDHVRLDRACTPCGRPRASRSRKSEK